MAVVSAQAKLDRPAGDRRSRLRCGLGALVAGLLLAACSKPAPLAGTDLGALPAPDFTLADQNGESLQLASLHGKPVVLTFLYTSCPDICPLTAAKLRLALNDLGSQGKDVALVAVSTDPEHDDAAAARAFVERHGLDGSLRFLIGDRGALAAVWGAYYVHAAPAPAQADLGDREASAAAARTAVHTDALFVIDKQGRERTLLRSDFDPPALSGTLRTLLRE